MLGKKREPKVSEDREMLTRHSAARAVLAFYLVCNALLVVEAATAPLQTNQKDAPRGSCP